MRALLTPEVAPRTGIVLFKPGPDLLKLFKGRVVISTPTMDLTDKPSGLLNDSTQPLLDEPSLAAFFGHERVITAAGGLNALASYVQSLGYCQWEQRGTWHYHEFTMAETESGPVSICCSHDTEFMKNGMPGRMDAIAKRNAALWIIRVACSQMALPVDHLLTLPELCWWASLNDVVDLIPETPARRVLRMPKDAVPQGELKESLIAPVRPATEIIQEAGQEVKRIITLQADPESPESFMLRPKRRRWKNAKYTRWVKSQPCACCNMQADDPHHIIGYGQGGMGTKSHDLFVIPLCRAHHDELHRDVRAFEEKYGSQIVLLFRFIDYAIAVGVIGSSKN
ncbi:DUF968 domain-containing protein [Pantoea agglomerans]|uniref:DUF968 domain-containing protein n=1 Tax=Enterobacter agglomerans TaxID=549 RepID=UPI00390AEDEB